MNESKIIGFLQDDKQERAFSRLYKFYPKVEKHVLINSGSKDEALDIYQDGLVILYKKVTDPNFDLSNSQIKIEGFLINTCKLLWSNELRKKKVRSGDDSKLSGLQFDSVSDQDDIQKQIEKENKFKIIEDVIKKLGDKCRSILEMFYYKSQSMDSIAKKLGYKTVKSAKVQKYKCMEHARKLALEITNDKNLLS